MRQRIQTICLDVLHNASSNFMAKVLFGEMFRNKFKAVNGSTIKTIRENVKCGLNLKRVWFWEVYCLVYVYVLFFCSRGIYEEKKEKLYCSPWCDSRSSFATFPSCFQCSWRSEQNKSDAKVLLKNNYDVIFYLLFSFL